MKLFLFLTLNFLKTFCKSDYEKDLEILALRSQLALVEQHILTGKIKKTKTVRLFRHIWAYLSKNFTEWKSALILIKPETVIGWHRKAFKAYWRRKSCGGRPRISPQTIALIKRIHKENPLLSPEKIHERLVALNITNVPAPNTIAKYLPNTKRPPSEKQKLSWQSFLQNHRHNIWAMDFCIVPSVRFRVMYVLLVINHCRRKIEHFAVTTAPSAEWVAQQIRNATPYEKQPKYLIHDNDAIFRAVQLQKFLTNSNIIPKRTAFHSPWQNGICERLIGIVRRELLDHIIPFNQAHLERLLGEYVDYYNNVRTHKTLSGKSPIIVKTNLKTSVENTSLSATPILGGMYHRYDKVA